MTVRLKSIWGIVLAIVCAAIMGWTGAFFANADSTSWEQHADTSWYDPVFPSYSIRTAAQLAGVAKLVNDAASGVDGFDGKILDIENDIDLSAYSWVPIGTTELPFKGTLIAKNGATYTISGMKLTGNLAYAGFIGYMDGGTVGGFIFDRGTIDVQSAPTVARSVYSVSQSVYFSARAAVNEAYVGAAVGKMVSHSTVYGIMNKIPIQVNSTALSVAAVGGIVGSGEGSLSNSANNGPLIVKGQHVYVGGIAGHAEQAGLKLKKLANNGAVRAEAGDGADAYAAGVIGRAAAAVLMDEESTPVSNNADVTVLRGSNSYAGGIVGKAEARLTFSSNTANNGAVVIDAPQAASSYAGALIGAATALPDKRTFDLTFKSTKPVKNYGGTNVHTGGIAGWIDGGPKGFAWAQNFDNRVTIEATGTKDVFTGGLIGKGLGTITFDGAVRNSGAVAVSGGASGQKPDNAYTGGLVGHAGRLLLEHKQDNAYENSGSIFVTGGSGLYTGGIVANTAYVKQANNVASTGNITVNGQNTLYTGGFVGFVPNEAADKSLSGETFGSTIAVTAAAPDADKPVSTGGIVGSYVSASGGALTNVTFKGKLTSIGGGKHTYTGGIAGYADGATITGAKAGNIAESFASIEADGSLGGVAGYINGHVVEPTVKHISLTAKLAGGIAGGVAGEARGAITAANVGDGADNAPEGNSVTITATANDQTAGGIIGKNAGALAIVQSKVARIGLTGEGTLSVHKLGGAAGETTAAARVGEPESPIEVKRAAIQAKAGSSQLGGAVGSNGSPAVYVKANSIDLTVEGADTAAGGIVGKNDVGAAHYDAAVTAMNAANIKVNAVGDNAHIGGIYGDNRNHAPKVTAELVAVTAAGKANRIGGIAGLNSAVLTDSSSQRVTVQSAGAESEIGGIAGRSEGTEASAAKIVNPLVLAGDEPIISASGSTAKVGGIVGYAERTLVSAPVVKEAEVAGYARIAVKGEHSMAGGIAGHSKSGVIEGDAAKVNVANAIISATDTAAKANVGGIAGYNEETKLARLVGASVSLAVNGQETVVGGIAGYNKSTDTAILTSNYMDAVNIKVNGSAASSTVGGFVGKNAARANDPAANPATAVSTIQKSRVVGTITVDSPSSVTGGMVGENGSLIANNSIVDKNVVISRGNNGTIGGLAGINTEKGTLYYTYSNASLTIEGEGSSAGGLVGVNKDKGRIIASYVDIPVIGHATGTPDASVFLGGLAGINNGTIDRSYANSAVTTEGAYTNVGGLVGLHEAGSIVNSYAAGAVTANNANSYAGGFLGKITNGKVSTVYSAGHAAGANGAYAGGFAGRYDNESKELLYKVFYIKDEDAGINKDLPDFAEGNHRFLNVHARLSTILAATLEDRVEYPRLSGWDFNGTWKWGSLNADYKYPELVRFANSGGDGGGNGGEVNANINWYTRNKDAVVFEVKSEAELAGLAGIVNGTITGLPKFDFAERTIRLSNAIHIQSRQWVPIGSSEDNAFQGIFVGNDHLIDGYTVAANQPYAGLFGVIGDRGKVERLKLEPVSVAGQQYAGALAGYNKGTVSAVDVRLIDAVKISGQTAGGAIGKNTGAFGSVHVTLDGGSLEGAGERPVAGGVIGDNASVLGEASYRLQANKGSIGSSSEYAIIGGVIGKQDGDASGLKVDFTGEYRMSSAAAHATMGGLIGHQTSGKTDNSTVVLGSRSLEALGQESVVGGAIGQSDANNTIGNIAVTAAQEGPHMTGTNAIGGIVGAKAGKGGNGFDIDQATVDGALLSDVEGSPQATIGGIAGKLANTAVRQAVFKGTIRALADTAAVGGVAGHATNSIVYKADVSPQLSASAKTGETAVGGIAGIMESDDVNKEFQFGYGLPLYRGIYDAAVQAGTFTVTGADSSELYVGGIAGKLEDASIYQSSSSSVLQIQGGKTAAVGGVAGYSSGIIVDAVAANGISAESGTIYHVGGAVGRAKGGEIHYSNVVSPAGQNMVVGRTITRQGIMPAAHIGGFVGMADGTTMMHVSANVPIQVVCNNSDNTIYAGGFAGLLGESSAFAGNIVKAYASGNLDVQGAAGSFVGGFAGSVDHYNISDAYASGSVTNAGFDTRSGGFAGVIERRGSVQNSYAAQARIATTGINHATRSYTGGFVGYNDGAVDKAFAKPAAIAVAATGANVHNGAFVGYNFRDGQIKRSSYMNASAMEAVGRNAGGAVDATVTAEDLIPAFGFGKWNFTQDASFLFRAGSADIVVMTGEQLGSAALLANDTELSFYRLFNRNAETKPSVDRLTLGADIDLSGIAWTPIADFAGTLDGKGHKITNFIIDSANEKDYGLVSRNSGTIARLAIENASVAAGARTGIVAAVNGKDATISDIAISGKVQGTDWTGGVAGVNEGSISNVRIQSLTVTGGANTGGVAGDNSGVIREAAVKGKIAGTSFTGGIAGINTGAIGKSYTKADIRSAQTGRSFAGGIAGDNGAAGTISETFSYSNVDAASDEAAAGGIAGRSGGTIVHTYQSGRIKAEGTAKAWAGGLAGYAGGGSIRSSMNYGEAAASVGGVIVPGAAYFGGIAGQKAAAAEIRVTAFDKQMLKANTAYYDASGTRASGDAADSLGILTRDLTKGTLPTIFDPAQWQASQGFYPQLKPFSSSDDAKLSTVAFVLNEKDTINRIRSSFELTRDASVVWTADPADIAVGNGIGTLKASGSAVLTASVNGASRQMTIHTPALKFKDTARKPVIASAEASSSGDQVTVKLGTDEAGSRIYYTLDGSMPDTFSLPYTDSLVLQKTTGVKAVAIVEDKEPSEPLTETVAVKARKPFVISAAPSVNKDQVTVTLGTDEAGGRIYYTTDGSVPDTNSLPYTQPIVLTETTTVKAVTVADDHEHSVPLTETWTVKAKMPKIVSAGETSFRTQATVTLGTDEAGGRIYFTTDGSVPDAKSQLYTGPITLTQTTTIKAVTVAERHENSEILSETWTKQSIRGGGGGGGFYVPAPEPSAPALSVNIGTSAWNGENGSPVVVARNSRLTLTAPAGHIVYYTTDGSTPTKNSARYTGEIIVKGSMTIKAITDQDDRVIVINCQVDNADFDWKSGTSQIKYIEGFEDGSFKPDAAITRYDLMYILDRLLDKENVNVAVPFADVRSGMEPLVAFFASAGIIDGYPDGTFGGSGQLTRAEFVALMSRVMKLNAAGAVGETALSDVKGHWAEAYVNAFTAAGYVDGFEDGTFRPDSQITRAQAVVLINRIIKADKQSKPAKFSDVAPDHWAYEDIMSVTR